MFFRNPMAIFSTRQIYLLVFRGFSRNLKIVFLALIAMVYYVDSSCPIFLNGKYQDSMMVRFWYAIKMSL